MGRTWLEERGLEAWVTVRGAEAAAPESWENLPAWASGLPSGGDDEAGEFARKMLAALGKGKDDEVRAWTETAIRKASEAEGQVFDPISLSILGTIVIGAILAARVKKIGPVQFYKGIPKELADVLKAASGIPALDGGD